jgi:hypothetical protein
MIFRHKDTKDTKNYLIFVSFVSLCRKIMEWLIISRFNHFVGSNLKRQGKKASSPA